MHSALRSINDNRHTMRMGDARRRLDRNRSRQNIRHMRQRDDFCARCEQLFVSRKIDMAVLVDVDPFEHGALALAQEMPGDDVGVMLHHRQDDFVALANMGQTE